MSRAFVKEDAGDDELPERPQSSSPNYVTPAGLDELRRRAAELKRRLAALAKDSREGRLAARDLRYIEGRLGSAILVDAKGRPGDEVRFGATVVLADPAGAQRTVRIVGQDEADETSGKLSWDCPLALAMMGAKPGAAIDHAGQTLRVVSIAYQ